MSHFTSAITIFDKCEEVFSGQQVNEALKIVGTVMTLNNERLAPDDRSKRIGYMVDRYCKVLKFDTSLEYTHNNLSGKIYFSDDMLVMIVDSDDKKVHYPLGSFTLIGELIPLDK